MRLPKEWEHLLSNSFDLNRFYLQLDCFLKQFGDRVIPEASLLFNVFHYVKPNEVRCILFGEDPYPRKSSACGVAFWDKEVSSWDQKTNGNSLKNILKGILVAKGYATYKSSIEECRAHAKKMNIFSPEYLFESWLNSGVFLLNTALTFTSKDEKKEHFSFWEPFIHAVIRELTKRYNPYYIFWGKKAERLESVVKEYSDQPQIIKQGHPTFIHQFLDKTNPTYSPFTELVEKTKMNWLEIGEHK